MQSKPIADLLVDTSQGKDRFDRIARMAAERFGTPFALINFLDDETQWIRSAVGLTLECTPRQWSFCAHAMDAIDGLLVVPDAHLDPRFVDNPLVTGEPHIRFYAGVAIRTASGGDVGAVCVLDTEPRPVPPHSDLEFLQSLAWLAADQIELVEANDALEERRSILGLAELLSQTGYWTLRISDGAVTWSPQVYAIHGVTPEEFDPAFDDAIAFYLDEDRERVARTISESVAERRGWDIEARLRRTDGQVRTVNSLAACRLDSAGEVAGFVGVFRDLTEERAETARVKQQERRYRLLADNSTDVIAVYDANGTLSYVSPSVEDVLGFSPQDLVGSNTYDIVHADDRMRVAREFEEAFRSRETRPIQYRAVRRDGIFRWLEARPRFIFDEQGAVVEINDTVRDVTRRIEREEALARARVEAEAAAESKANFLSVMSHEIRTPLGGILGFAELLGSTDLTKEQRSYLERILTAGKGLSALVDDILDFSKLESMNMQLSADAVNLRQMIDEVASLLSFRKSDATQIHQCVAEDVAPHIEGDYRRLRQILINLVGNAVKFTEAGQVAIDAYRAGDTLCIEVRDTGIGIPEEALPNIFNSFSQGDASIGRTFGGTGLGLAISRSIARVMNGDVVIESVHGQGTTARISLPYREASIEAGVRAAPSETASRPLRVLVVDDLDINRELVELMLESMGHEVTTASSGREAIDRLRDGDSFDIVLMDVQMPEMDGMEATRAIRDLDGDGAKVFIAALTANVLPQQIQACYTAGMDDYLSKPIDQVALANLLSQVGSKTDR